MKCYVSWKRELILTHDCYKNKIKVDMSLDE